jgi:D-psicose/D-tagatose/L-ribulose 3-epimerase
MRLAVSNIAWPEAEDREVEDALRSAGVDALEAAPARLLADPFDTSEAEATRVADEVRDRGFELVAFQSLLFGAQDIGFLGSAEQRQRTADLLARVVRVAGAMGVPVLVYGSPSTRRIPDGMSSAEAWDRAAEFFAGLAGTAADAGTTLCIEPNPARYGCDLVRTSDEGAALVRMVGLPGFGLHLDAAGMMLSGEDLEDGIRRSGPPRHFHASAPDLGALEEEVVDHAAAARGLRAVGYDGVVSIEMRSGEPGAAASRVRSAVELVSRRYGLQLAGSAA